MSNNIVGFSDSAMYQGSEISNFDIKPTTFALLGHYEQDKCCTTM